MELSSWLALIRTFQLLGALACTGLNGFLIGLIYTRRLGLNTTMVGLELMIVLLLLYTSIAIVLQHTGGRSRMTGWLVSFIVCDVIFTTVDMAIITLLAGAGLPGNCGGMTAQNYEVGDTPNDPAPGYTTVRFSNESAGQRGELDQYCGFERSFYFVALGIIFLYIITIVLTVLRICEKLYTKNSRVAELLDSLRGTVDDAEKNKLLDDNGAAAARASHHAPVSEGIITRATSVRSAMTASTRSDGYARPLVGTELRRLSLEPPPLPDNTRRVAGAGTAGTAAEPGARFGGPDAGFGMAGDEAYDDDGEESAQAALVADGMQHQHRALARERLAAPRVPLPMPMPMLAEDEERAAAQAAVVSDGMRPSEPMLPPYEPGQARMPGHADESNEMRLSEYVKGQTRAQDMKDADGF